MRDSCVGPKFLTPISPAAYAAFAPCRISSVPGVQLYVSDTVLEGDPAAFTASR